MKSLFNEIYFNMDENTKDYILSKDYKNIVIAIDNIPNMFYECKRNIIRKVNTYIENRLDLLDK